MTEDQWRSCQGPAPMLAWLRTSGQASDRKLRLFACACCGRCIPLLPPDSFDEDGRPWSAAIQQAVERGERIADGHARVVEAAPSITWTCVDGYYAFLSCAGPTHQLPEASENVCWAVGQLDFVKSRASHSTPAKPAEVVAHAHLLRCIFDNPFRPVTVGPALRTSAVLELAQLIYDERRFDLMPVLGMALSDAGCSDQEILRHCASLGPHARGCHVVDLLLLKK